MSSYSQDNAILGVRIGFPHCLLCSPSRTEIGPNSRKKTDKIADIYMAASINILKKRWVLELSLAIFSCLAGRHSEGGLLCRQDHSCGIVSSGQRHADMSCK